jgi:RNA polymerase sigma-70 factor (sigma-E family)
MLSAKVDHPTAVDGSTIEDLYVRHADAATRLAFLLTGDHSLAEDLVQDAFVKITGRLVHLRDRRAFEHYLRTSIVNLSHSYFRRRRVERAYLDRLRNSAARTPVDAPDHRFEDGEELWRALGTLSSRQRAAIVLRFYEDLPDEEIAELLGCKVPTVRTAVFRGLEKLRKVVER